MVMRRALAVILSAAGAFLMLVANGYYEQTFFVWMTFVFGAVLVVSGLGFLVTRRVRIKSIGT